MTFSEAVISEPMCETTRQPNLEMAGTDPTVSGTTSVTPRPVLGTGPDRRLSAFLVSIDQGNPSLVDRRSGQGLR